MKNIVLLIIQFLWISVSAQFSIVDIDHFDIEVPKNIKSYSIYCHSTSLGWQEVYNGKRILLKRVLVSNGQRAKITEYYPNRAIQVQYNFYNKGLLQKAVVHYKKPKSNEQFYYTYDSISNEPIDIKGYKDRKLIYTESRSVNLDTIGIFKNFINVNGYQGKEKTFIYYSKDKLIKTEVEYRTNSPDTNYSFTMFNQINQIIEEVDSSSDHYDKTTFQYNMAGRIICEKRQRNSAYNNNDNVYNISLYNYDLDGRLREEIVSSNDKERYRIQHDTLFRETISTKYHSSVHQQHDTISLVIKRYDLQGNIIFKESVEYESKSLGTPTSPVGSSVWYWIYEDGRMVKYIYRKSTDGPVITYDITYDE